MSDGQTNACEAIAEQNVRPISPLPWRVGKHASIVCDDPRLVAAEDRNCMEFYGGHLVCETVQPSDIEFILATVNATIADEPPASTDPVARFAALEHERRAVEDRLDAIKKEEAKLQERILEEWLDRGQKSANVAGLTIYVAQDFYCSKKAEISTEQIIDVLKAAGLERCVQIGYNASSLKAFIKEQLVAGSELPTELSKCVNYDTVARLRTRLA